MMAPKKLRPPRRNRGCLVCGQRYTPKRKGSMYCSGKCKQKAWRWKREREE